jgi:cellulose synthase/poly-beta-1,6-N-acetylglucosamine synthase-like glycosyltransferase
MQQRSDQQATESLEQLVQRLVREGEISDGARSRHRIALGFPPWLVLDELGTAGILRELSRASGLSVLDYELSASNVDVEMCERVGPDRLLEVRWVPLVDGRVAIANPYGRLPDGLLVDRSLTLAPAAQIDQALDRAFPGRVAGLRNRRRLGRFLLDAGAVTEQALAQALAEQQKNGGRLGEILVMHNLVDPASMTTALAGRAGITAVEPGAQPLPLLPRAMAHELRAVAIEMVTQEERVRPLREVSPVTVAFVDPSEEIVSAVRAELGRSIRVQVTDDETLDALLASVYAQDDAADVVESLRREMPHLSAYRTGLSRPQVTIVAGLPLAIFAGVVLDAWAAAVGVAAVATLAYVLYTIYRLVCAWRGWRLGSTVNPTPEQLAEMDGRELPTYTVLLPVFREKATTIRALLRSLSELDYPKQKLNGLLLLEQDDSETIASLAEVEAATPGIRPRWLRTLTIPPGEPRTKPKAMIYGLLYSTGELLTIFDAEDKPEPDQLKKAAWAFQRSSAEVACIQAKLSYYNSRQNLLTRWFTLEYAAWFDLFLPGLHSMSAPIPLGGTSNHFRLQILREVLSWDPYNVTEDADLGLRFSRAGYRTQMLESTTFEEANSKFGNWLRQRSRWIKGYIQTFLVHTRNPLQLYRELGLVNSAHFLFTVGGLIYTVLVSPIFWLLLVWWLLFQPAWIPALFPGPVYYLAMASLAFGNFFFVLLALIGAVGRGHDDLSPYTLVFPVYWLMMSCAGYLAVYELIRRPHHWQKTEHGLHTGADEPEPRLHETLPSEDALGRAA